LMTEAEWLGSSEPEAMLLFLSQRQTSDRKVRLFGCACVRRVWGDLADEQLRRAAEVAERYADGGATARQLEAARKRSAALCEGVGDIIADHGPMAVVAICEKTAGWFVPSESTLAVASEARSDEGADWDAAHEQEQGVQATAIRDVFGNPFRPRAAKPGWLTPNILSVAQAAYDQRQLPSGELDPHRLAILADALADAGAPNELTAHLRSPGPHVRGCFAVDLVLDKS
jgi:hypothetical protein